MSEAKNPSIDWPPEDTVKFVVGFDDKQKNIKNINKSGYIEISTLPNARAVKGDRSEK